MKINPVQLVGRVDFFMYIWYNVYNYDWDVIYREKICIYCFGLFIICNFALQL